MPISYLQIKNITILSEIKEKKFTQNYGMTTVVEWGKVLIRELT